MRELAQWLADDLAFHVKVLVRTRPFDSDLACCDSVDCRYLLAGVHGMRELAQWLADDLAFHVKVLVRPRPC